MSDSNGNGGKYDPIKKLQDMVNSLPPVDEISIEQSNHQQQRQREHTNRKKQVGRLHYIVSSVSHDFFFSFVCIPFT